MTRSDIQFEAQASFCDDLTNRIRELVASPDGLDPDDVLVYELEHLIKVFVALHRAGLAVALPAAKEVLEWKSALLARFDDHRTEWQGTEKGFDHVRLQYVETFDDLISICDSNS